MSLRTAAGALLQDQAYAYDAASRLASSTLNGVTTSYGYDSSGQLTSESRAGYVVGYTYDANGNRLTKTLNGVTDSYAYDAGDKLLSAGNKTYTYDSAGRTRTVVSPAGTTTLTYDYESRVTSVVGPGVTAYYAYNGLDARLWKGENGGSVTSVRDGAGVTAPVVRDSQSYYVPGVSETRAGVTTYLHSGLKDATAQTSAAQAVTATRVYDAFGMVVSSTGTWKGPFGYGGEHGYQEDATGLQLLGHRYYDPSTGRFLTRDPAKDGRNWYGYSGNEPVQRSDPTGNCFLTSVCGTAAVDAGVIGGTSSGSTSTTTGLSFANWIRAVLAAAFGVDAASEIAIDAPDVYKNRKKPRRARQIYRVGNPRGEYWSTDDLSLDPDYF